MSGESQRLWDAMHTRFWGNRERRRESKFARDVASRLSKGARVLELGCGDGLDAAYLSRRGFQVTAIDFSGYAIAMNRRHLIECVDFLVHDLRAPLPFESEHFDVVYAHLAMHYFTDQMTRDIFAEVHRVLQPTGKFYFMCKSVADPLYGRGTRIERDMFDLDGEVRHFFSDEYVRHLLTDELLFKPERVAERRATLYGSPSRVIHARARPAGRYRQLRLL